MRIFIFLSLLIFTNSALANEAFFDETKVITAQEELKSDDYIHQGVADDKYQELCKDSKEYSDICTNDNSAFSGGTEKTLEAMIPAVTKVYSMISMFGGSEFTSHNVNDNGDKLYKQDNASSSVTGDKALDESGELKEGYSEDTESKKDYCSYMTVAIETVGAAYMTLQNQKTQTNYSSTKPEARQAASFYALSDTHKSMGKASKNQGYLWGAVTGCYGVMLATQNISGDWKIYAKLAGSVLITAFHFKKASAHEDRSKMLSDMASKLPQAGDCNPYTETTCFCNEESSRRVDIANYQKFCVPQIIAARTTEESAFICVDEKGQTDLECSCSATNSCLDKVLKMGALDFGLSPTVMKNPLKALTPVSNGFGSSGIDTATRQNLKFGKTALEKFKPKTLPALSTAQKEMAKEFNKLGIPKAASVFLAKTKTKGIALPKSMASMSPTGKGSNALSNSGYRNSNRKKSKTFSSGGEKSVKSSTKGNPFSRFTSKKKKAQTGIEIEDFALRAQRKAEIVEDQSKGIFDIISYRYKMSAWKKFAHEFKIDENPDPEKK